MGWLSGPEAAGLEAEENGGIEGALWELLTGAEVAATVNFSLRLTLTAEVEGGKEGFTAIFGADTLGTGVLSRVGLKPDDPKENEAADGPVGDAAGVRAREALEGGTKEKVDGPGLGAALELSEPLEYEDGSPVTVADDFKDEEPKENTVGDPPAGSKEKVAMGAAGDEGGREAGAAAAEASSFCGA